VGLDAGSLRGTTDDGGQRRDVDHAVIEDSSTWFVCAACGGPIGVYERCFVDQGDELLETSWLSLDADERQDALASGVYHAACSRRPGAADDGS
jgi:hypothetical protein